MQRLCVKAPCEGAGPAPGHSTRCPMQSRPWGWFSAGRLHPHGCTDTSCTPALRGNFCLRKEQSGIQCRGRLLWTPRAWVREGWVLVLWCQTAMTPRDPGYESSSYVPLHLELMTSIHSCDWRWCFSSSASWQLLYTFTNSAGPQLLYLEKQIGLLPSSHSPERTFFLPIIQESLFSCFRK